MYNRYVRNDTGQYQRFRVQEEPRASGEKRPEGEPTERTDGLLGNILSKLNLREIDSGDLLLLVVLFLLFREGADEELLIALGLLLIL